MINSILLFLGIVGLISLTFIAFKKEAKLRKMREMSMPLIVVMAAIIMMAVNLLQSMPTTNVALLLSELNARGYTAYADPAGDFSAKNVYPETDATYDLGKVSAQWRRLYLSGQLISTQATGTAPLSVASTTVNTNLNADLLDGQHAPSGTIVGTTDNQTLSTKTLTSPTISSPTFTGTSTGGTFNSATLASPMISGTVSAATITTLTTTTTNATTLNAPTGRSATWVVSSANGSSTQMQAQSDNVVLLGQDAGALLDWVVLNTPSDGVIALSAGVFTFKTQWDLVNNTASNLLIRGQGMDSTKLLADTTMGKSFIIQIANNDNNTFMDFTVDGNRANRTIPDLPSPPQGGNAEGYNNIQVFNSNNQHFIRVATINSPEIGLNFRGTSNNFTALYGWGTNNMAGTVSLYGTTGDGEVAYWRIDGSNLQYAGVGAAGITGNNYSNANIHDNEVWNAFDGFTGGDGSGAYNRWVNNFAHNNIRNGFSFSTGPTDSLVANNIALRNGGNGFSAGSSINRMRFSSNKALYNTSDGYDIYHAIDVQFNDNDGQFNGVEGLHLSGYSTNVTWQGGSLTDSVAGYGARLGTDNLSSGAVLTDTYFNRNALGALIYTPASVTNIARNRGLVTENSGTVTMLANHGAIDVNWALSVNATSVQVSFAGNPGVATTLYTGNISAAWGTIYATTNVTANTPIWWRAVSFAGN